MKILAGIVTVLLAIGMVIILFLGYMGFFSKMKVTEKMMGPYTIVYESFVGPYKETGKVFSELYEKLKKDGIETTFGLGIYYDDPSKVAPEQCRSDCGCVINESDLAKLETLKADYKIKTLDQRLSLVTEFPIRNNISYMIGPMKGYSALTSAAKNQNKMVDTPFEYYDMKKKKIYFIAPVKEE